MIKFSIVITTKNRLKDLKFTLKSLETTIKRQDVELLICDDASNDGTQEFLKNNFAHHKIVFNKKSKGLIYNRNILNNKAKGDYIISLDDDANFLTSNFLNKIENYFKKEQLCAVISFRVFWGLDKPNLLITSEEPKRVNSFIGCGHVWKKKHWLKIPNYPSWFIFYGEENFASFQLFKQNLEVHYNPNILVHHRVNISGRKKNKDYSTRLRRSLRSGWYLYGLFYPIKVIPKLFFYSLWIQFKNRIFKGDFRALFSIFGAILDVLISIPKIISNSSRLTLEQYKFYRNLPEAKIYWKPETDNKIE